MSGQSQASAQRYAQCGGVAWLDTWQLSACSGGITAPRDYNARVTWQYCTRDVICLLNHFSRDDIPLEQQFSVVPCTSWPLFLVTSPLHRLIAANSTADDHFFIRWVRIWCITFQIISFPWSMSNLPTPANSCALTNKQLLDKFDIESYFGITIHGMKIRQSSPPTVLSSVFLMPHRSNLSIV